MLPAVFLGTLPQTACICADGHRAVICPAVQQIVNSRAATKSCCGKRNVQSGLGCCGNSAANADNKAVNANGIAQTCCRRIIELPPAVTIAKKLSSLDCQPIAI